MEEGRVLSIDFGRKRVGIALSDPTGTLATPLETLTRRSGQRPPWKKVEEIVRAHEVRGLVMGLPLGLEGEETAWCEEIRQAGDALATRLGLPIDYVDERFSSVQAERAIRAQGLRKSERSRKGRVDAAAAAVILQGWLDRRESR
jgi:putative pre-16S rRNA nuclease